MGIGGTSSRSVTGLLCSFLPIRLPQQFPTSGDDNSTLPVVAAKSLGDLLVFSSQALYQYPLTSHHPSSKYHGPLVWVITNATCLLIPSSPFHPISAAPQVVICKSKWDYGKHTSPVNTLRWLSSWYGVNAGAYLGLDVLPHFLSPWPFLPFSLALSTAVSLALFLSILYCRHSPATGFCLCCFLSLSRHGLLPQPSLITLLKLTIPNDSKLVSCICSYRFLTHCDFTYLLCLFLFTGKQYWVGRDFCFAYCYIPSI